MRARPEIETSRAGKKGTVVTLPVEAYSPERVAEFLLSNAVDEEDYAEAVERVKAMGLDSDAISHTKQEQPELD